jgi:hypothetical protein
MNAGYSKDEIGAIPPDQYEHVLALVMSRAERG